MMTGRLVVVRSDIEASSGRSEVDATTVVPIKLRDRRFCGKGYSTVGFAIVGYVPIARCQEHRRPGCGIFAEDLWPTCHRRTDRCVRWREPVANARIGLNQTGTSRCPGLDTNLDAVVARRPRGG